MRSRATDHEGRFRATRREFLLAMGSTAVCALSQDDILAAETPPKRDVYIVPNFHPASCGWLTTFSKERIYCANSYLSHLDRVRDDPSYRFVLSEVNNVVAIMNFHGERIPELKKRVTEGRVELVNSFFLESTINLSGGEALVRLGVLGQRWYQEIFQTTPRFAWNIDTCGVHDQMPQIAAGLGLAAMIYTRKNPTGKTLFWSVAPDASKILTLCPGSYTDAGSIFSTKTPLTDAQLNTLETFFETKDAITPEGAPVVVLGGSEDYSLAPTVPQYPREFLTQWSHAESQRKILFATLSEYVDKVKPEIEAGKLTIPTFRGGTAYDFDAFWIENATVKTLYRSNEHALQAAEALATVASLTQNFAYPAQDLQDAWILMLLNMDRNTLWGSAGGMVFVDDHSWDVQDRFNWVKELIDATVAAAGPSLSKAGAEIAFFNPLSWRRDDPIRLELPPGKSLENIPCEQLDSGLTLCQVEMLSMSAGSCKLINQPPVRSVAMEFGDTIETRYYVLKLNRSTGAISSLKLKASGRELISENANRIVAERPKKKPDDPSDHMPPIPEREHITTSADAASTIEATRGPVTISIHIAGTFLGGRLVRGIRLYHDHPRIDFETELNDVPDYTVVYAEFPFSADVTEVRRGIPYGFSHGAWSVPNPDLHGWTRGIVPAVRWSHYALEEGSGVALLDRGLSGRELNGRTAAIYLINAEDKYWGYPNSWLSGRGKHILHYALFPHAQDWDKAAVARAAWEYNCEPITIRDRAETPSRSFLTTSDNVIVEAMRREHDHIELRLVECLGLAGVARVSLSLPHRSACFTDLTGRTLAAIEKSEEYAFPIRPQQIVTMHFSTLSTVVKPEPVTKWDRFVPQSKLAALNTYDPKLIGHPPFGA